LFAHGRTEMGALLGAFFRGTEMALTDAAIRAAKPKDRDYKPADAGRCTCW
jgi:hypothetical protein